MRKCFSHSCFFRDNYKGGSHWADLEKININSTKCLLKAALKAGVKQFVHVFSIAVLDGVAGTLIDETCDRDIKNSDDYYRSKIISERTVREFAAALIMVTFKGKPGERYLAAGRHIHMEDLVSMIGHYANVKTPTKTIPIPLLYCIAVFQEIYGKLTGKPILLSLASVRLVASQYDRTHFSRERYYKILGLQDL